MPLFIEIFLLHASHEVLSSHCQPRLNITANPSGLPGPLQLSSLLRCRFALARDFGPLDLKLENMPGFGGQLPPRDAAP